MTINIIQEGGDSFASIKPSLRVEITCGPTHDYAKLLCQMGFEDTSPKDQVDVRIVEDCPDDITVQLTGPDGISVQSGLPRLKKTRFGNKEVLLLV